ncbi:hypothetical protein MVEN_00176200 [Mycena venus]|uniref:Uncharacterized protein n=1 Tax=Mycena venus TaxID=2733690 RepID=A0A8H7DAP4_9AGAR|nr:hypothetical protein MVEN_00176200 [Mycena venus]
MTFTSFAIFAALLAVPAALAAETCSQMGTVSLPPKSLFWGTTSQTNQTATPIGWSTSASAPNDTNGHGILAVRSSTSPTLWGAFDCAGLGGGAPGGVVNSRANGGTTSGPPGGGNSGNPGGGGGGGGGNGGTGGANGLVNFFGAIGDSASNLCLTANFNNLNNMTITRATCIQPLNLVPDPTQAWQWSASEDQHVLVPTVLDSLVFIGTQATSVLAIGSTTNYVPTLVGTGVGAYVALEQDVGGLNPANAATEPGLLISFTPAA